MIEFATGFQLDVMGILYGARKRQYMEGDDHYRKIVLKSMIKENKMEHKKDYSLLRQFDLEAAKCGDKIFWFETECTFFGKSLNKFSQPMYVVEHVSGMSYVPFNELRMSPLAWVEGRPVYKGDVLYSNYESIKGEKRTIIGLLGEDCLDCEESSCCPCSLTWQKPKTKREGWVNVYKSNTITHRHNAKEKADECATSNLGGIDTDRVACIRIEWEE